MKAKEVYVKDYLSKSNLPSSDYVINPYVGCTHGCKYCYASFMKRFTGHTEEWGTFIDIKRCDKKIDLKKIEGKSIFISSVTDCYNEYEEKYEITRGILEQLVDVNVDINISTKSKLILRDLDILKKLKQLTVSMSVNTLDEQFRADMDNGSSISDRLDTLKILHENGIYVTLFMSPIFPYITDFKSIIEKSSSFINEYYFEDLNLRGDYKGKILNYIYKNYTKLYDEYIKIYIKNDRSYFTNLSKEIESYCLSNNIKYRNYFHHQKLVKDKKYNNGGKVNE